MLLLPRDSHLSFLLAVYGGHWHLLEPSGQKDTITRSGGVGCSLGPLPRIDVRKGALCPVKELRTRITFAAFNDRQLV